jgi:HK97 family phage prohead protease
MTKRNLENTVFKAGTQSADDPFSFVLSDESVDRMGDVIRADGWSLTEFKKNPVALFSHDHSAIVGVWKNIEVVGKRLIADLQLAAPGTSDLVDTVRSLVEQGILKAVSVGFQPIEAKPRKSGDGYEFIKSALHEASLVAVPANSNSLQIIRCLKPSVADIVFAKYGTLDNSAESGQSTHNQTTPRLDAARERLKSMGID